MSSQQPELDDLKLRIEKLERQSKSLKRVLFAVIAMAGALVFMGQANPNPRIVTAHDFVVRNDQGKEIASLGIDGLLLYDSHGENKLRAFADDTLGGVLLTWDAKTNQTIGVTGRAIRMTDKNHKIDSVLSRDALELHEENGKVRLQVFVHDEASGLSVVDENGYSVVVGKFPTRNVVTGSMDTGSAASVLMFDNHENLIWRAPN